MRVRLTLLAAAWVAMATVAASAGTPVSLARFTKADTSKGTFSTATLQPPTSLAASVAGTVVTLTWTPSTSTSASGYDVLRSTTSGSGYGSVGSVTPVTASTTTDSPGSGTFYYVLRTVFQNWRSANSNEVSAALGSVPSGFKDCGSTAADTGGDGDGYEVTPANGCGLDGAFAKDVNSGTTSSLVCSDPGQDRQRYWGYAFGLPGSVSSINGITVKPTVKVGSNGGSSSVCLQLSWDGGTSWTALQQVAVNNTLTTYTLGSATDTWGHSWTLAQLGPTSFRVRIVDVASMSGKDFSLDAITVQVNYTP